MRSLTISIYLMKCYRKNDIGVYQKVYRYKVYEVSYWNNLLGEKLAGLMSEPEQFVNAYIDELNKLGLHEQTGMM